MINQEEFVFRLKKVMEYYNETAASFSEKIGVQRSSISHILSGRNKPSLEFVMKVLSSYKEIDLYWLLNGKGSFPKTKTLNTNPQTTNSDNIIAEASNSNEIDRIIIFTKTEALKTFRIKVIVSKFASNLFYEILLYWFDTHSL